VLTSLAGGRLLADKHGATPPKIVALHGWGRTGADFAPIVAGLDAVAVHFPGFGTAEPPPEVWGSHEYAELVAEAIRPFAPVVVVGHSFGGRVAVRLAANYPNLVSALVLTGVPLVRLAPTSKPVLSYRLVRWLSSKRIVPASVLENQKRKHGSADYNAAQGVMRDILVKVVNENYDDDLARVTAPVHMVWGENDTAAPMPAGDAASRLIPNATFRSVPGAGHLLEGALRDELRAELLEVAQ
jgi:pimeloyl-ACP methyl ester carboxylesterase